MGKSKKKLDLSTLLVAFIVLVIYLFRFHVLKTPYYSDELGYWAAGAWINGIDWSPIFSRSAYYGWGYGVILAPLFWIGSSEVRFQIAVLINIAMMMGSYILLIFINNKLFSGVGRGIISIVSGVAILYSYNIVYAHLTMCESLLTLLFLLSIKGVIGVCEKCTLKNYMLFSIILGIQIAVHLRTIVFLLAGGIVIAYLIYYRQISKRNVIISSLSILAVILFVFFIKDKLVTAQYINSNNIVNRFVGNDSFSQKFSELKSFISFDAWGRFFFSVLGKWFYLGCASFFCVWVGMRYYSQMLIRAFRNKNFDKKNTIILYIVISFLLALFLNAETVMHGARFDHVFYGRYTENVVPIIICAGLLTMIKNGIKIKEIILYALSALVMSLILYYFIKCNAYVGALPMEISGFAGILIRGNHDYGMQFTIYAVIVSLAASTAIYAVFHKNEVIGCAAIAVAWSIMAYRGLDLCAYPELNRQELIIEAANELEVSDRAVFTILPDDVFADIAIYVDVLWLQFHLGEKTMYTVAPDDIGNIPSGDLLVISRSYPGSACIASQYEDVWLNGKIYIIKMR